MIIAAELHFAASLLLYASRAPACTPIGVAWTVYGREWLQLFVLRLYDRLFAGAARNRRHAERGITGQKMPYGPSASPRKTPIVDKRHFWTLGV